MRDGGSRRKFLLGPSWGLGVPAAAQVIWGRRRVLLDVGRKGLSV